MVTPLKAMHILTGALLIAVGGYCAIQHHPYAGMAFVIAGAYAWSSHGMLAHSRLKRLLHVFGPSAVVLILVLAAGGGLATNLPRVDFGMFYSSGLLFRQDPSRLYDPQRQTEFLHSATGLDAEAHYLPFAYPPFVALLFVPFTALTFRSAYYAMFAANVALLGSALWWMSSKLALRRNQLLTLMVLTSAALPVYAVLVLGHLTFLGLLLLAMFATDLLENRDQRAGVWAGFMLFKPILFPVPILLLILQRRWRGVLACLCVCSALLALSLALVGWPGLRSNFMMLRLMTSEYLLSKNQSLRALVRLGGLGDWAWLALVILILTALWVVASRAGDQRWPLICAANAVLLCPPYLQFYDFSLGLVGIAIALSCFESITDRTRSLLFLAVLLPAALALAGIKDHPTLPLLPVVLLVFFAYSVRRALQT